MEDFRWTSRSLVSLLLFVLMGGTRVLSGWLVVAEGKRILSVIQLKAIVKGGIKERFAELRRMGIRTVMITGGNPLTTY